MRFHPDDLFQVPMDGGSPVRAVSGLHSSRYVLRVEEEEERLRERKERRRTDFIFYQLFLCCCLWEEAPRGGFGTPLVRLTLLPLLSQRV